MMAQQSANTHSNSTKNEKGQGNYKVIQILLSQQQNSSTPKRINPKYMITEMIDHTNYLLTVDGAVLLTKENKEKTTRAYSLQFQTHSKLIQQKNCQGTHKKCII